MHIVCYSHIFPNSQEPVRGPFIFLRNLHLQKLVDVSVVAPLPFAPPLPFVARWWKLFRVPSFEIIGGLAVHHPRYPKLPGSPLARQHRNMFSSALKTIRDIHLRKPVDVIEAPWLYPDALVAKEVGRALNIPVVATALGSDINEYLEEPLLLAHILEVMRDVDAVACVSKALASAGAKLGVPPSKFRVIYNGVDAKQFTPQDKVALRKELNLPLERRIVVFVGHHEYIKGMDTLKLAWPAVGAINGVPPLLVMIGSGPMRRALVQELEPQGVQFIEEQPHHLIQQWITAADALILPSYAEGVPNVLLEANACGVPIICTDVGGVPEIMADIRPDGSASNGVMVEAKCPEALARGIERVLATTFDPVAVRANALRFEWGSCAEGFHDLFEQVLRDRRVDAEGSISEAG